MNFSDVKPCSFCAGAIVPMHYRVTIEQVGVDAHSVRRHMGLAQMLGGHTALADVMGTGIETVKLNTWSGIVCLSCQNRILELVISHHQMAGFDKAKEDAP